MAEQCSDSVPSPKRQKFAHVAAVRKTLVLPNIGGRLHPLAPQVSATGKNSQGLGPEFQGFSKLIFEISRFWFSRGWKVCSTIFITILTTMITTFSLVYSQEYREKTS